MASESHSSLPSSSSLRPCPPSSSSPSAHSSLPLPNLTRPTSATTSTTEPQDGGTFPQIGIWHPTNRICEPGTPPITRNKNQKHLVDNLDPTDSIPSQMASSLSRIPRPVTLPSCLEDARIDRLPDSAYYIPSFISLQEEQVILAKISDAPKPRWKQLTHRRLQTWPSDLVNNKLIETPLPPWLTTPVINRLLSLPLSADRNQHIFSSSPHHAPNHVLINEYPPGVGIMPHKDGSAYHPVVCTVSLGASLCLEIYQNKDDGALDPEPAFRILQEPGSLLITTENLYTDYLHGISDSDVDTDLREETVCNWTMLARPEEFRDGMNQRALRTSLTYRDVMKVSRLGNKLGMLMNR